MGAATGVVDQHVETPAALLDHREQGGQRIGVAHVGGEELGLAAVGFRQCLRGIAPADQHAGAGGEIALRDARTDALGAAGDQHHLAGEIEVLSGHCMLLHSCMASL
ncbi:hypothetical protein D3C86_1560950 [compost metagenome]